ncbi:MULTISPECIES: NAD(P)/FAD-dependent oxidoreductase [Bradyrhizobium]|uniref:NAD(P)/FAD-dependent oxidoreductase n=1 Tax=Bradyrhizobium TaxID=374 RepID=UPI00155E2FA0|nr:MULTISPECIES: FAD-binding oxidoreductase [Bradyrhizobium]MDD1523636.1 FAD-binding oxidoreductase [Bradyrhizobium sp. WBAH30]MDD1547722.1 FAD-binding oxidoreductase [Bradyrhizobium sp. WBAH41]MDD1561363.1 FAD-binding oxidoreductase [Bradyrhizobium sp. WBAH23]MDD1568803.1 FAD-binding oxidoreductase [Bradyrhizobium sp. WBAH33]MDD1594779.1 FAD-binding oxidoreductase [Bradyrhizobium sp. WBAH42]
MAEQAYDPLVDDYPAPSVLDPETYWASVAGPPPQDDGAIQEGVEVDVAVIGGGYAGLSAALSLARDYGIRAIVLEARSVAWGCSGRNGSFARISGGRMPIAKLIKVYGEEVGKAYFNEMLQALNGVRAIIREGEIDCDVQPDGVYKVAAFNAHVEALKRETELYNDLVGYPARFVPKQGLAGIHHGAEAHGAMYFPDGFSMNPLKLARGICRLARRYGARVHPNSPVIGWQRYGGVHHLRTPSGLVKARKVIVATNGYTSSRLNPSLAARILPVHSQIIVSAPMDEKQIAGSLPSGNCMFDTRGLLFYYRRLPDGRMMFGGRSAITGKDAENPRHKAYMIDAMRRKFPALSQATVDYWWGGWVAVSMNSLPFVYAVPGQDQVFCGGGYAGSGVSFSVHVGSKLAMMAAGRTFATGASFLTREPRKYPFPAFMRLGQRIAYRVMQRKDTRESSKRACHCSTSNEAR